MMSNHTDIASVLRSRFRCDPPYEERQPLPGVKVALELQRPATIGWLNTHVLERHHDITEMHRLRAIIADHMDEDADEVLQASLILQEIEDKWHQRRAQEDNMAKLLRNPVGSKEHLAELSGAPPGVPSSNEIEQNKRERARELALGEKKLEYFERTFNRAERPVGCHELSLEQMYNIINAGFRKTIEHPLEMVSAMAFMDNLLGFGGPDFRLTPAQRESIGRCLHNICHHKSSLLADEMGAGKTVMILVIAAWLRRQWKGPGRHRTLIIVPKSLIAQWRQEIERFDPEAQLAVYYNNGKRMKNMNANVLKTKDIVLTTSTTIASEYVQLKEVQTHFEYARTGTKYIWEGAMTLKDKARQVKVAKRSITDERVEAPLFAIEWNLQVIDEAHLMKNQTTNMSLGACHITAAQVLLSTGTPVENDVGEIYAMLKLLRAPQFSDEKLFFACFRPGPELAQDISVLISQTLNCLLRTYLVRTPTNYRGTRSGSSIAPQGMVHVGVIVRLKDADQRATQTPTMYLWRPSSNDLPDSGEATSSSTLASINRARWAAIHPALPDAAYSLDNIAEVQRYDPKVDNMHLLQLYQESGAEPRRQILHELEIAEPDDVHVTAAEEETLEQRRIAFESEIMATPGGYRSAKIDSLISCVCILLKAIDQEANAITDDFERRAYIGRNKIIIFSPSLASLDLVNLGLRDHGISVLRLDGTIGTIVDRQAVIDDYEEVGKDYLTDLPSRERVMLATSTTAGTGLNLVHTRHVMILAPEWNPFITKQCIARAVRPGNKNVVRVWFFNALSSIEDYMRIVCSKKQKMYDDLISIEGIKALQSSLERLTPLKLGELFSNNSDFAAMKIT